jgi:hypothetical protein
MLLGSGTDDRVIMLQQLMFQYVGVWISTKSPRHLCMRVYVCVCACLHMHMCTCLLKIQLSPDLMVLNYCVSQVVSLLTDTLLDEYTEDSDHHFENLRHHSLTSISQALN